CDTVGEEFVGRSFAGSMEAAKK
ncbi:hypothetical protein A2U01_0065253, partial [Trifolium medium]|nr:hypothetical protein [Trifolium medium]